MVEFYHKNFRPYSDLRRNFDSFLKQNTRIVLVISWTFSLRSNIKILNNSRSCLIDSFSHALQQFSYIAVHPYIWKGEGVLIMDLQIIAQFLVKYIFSSVQTIWTTSKSTSTKFRSLVVLVCGNKSSNMQTEMSIINKE